LNVLRPDICVIGAGSGGLSVAAGAAQLGARVALVEGGRMGGDCLNTGCVPSKALLAAARHAALMRAGKPLGIAPAAPEVDFAAVMAHVAATIAAIAPHDSQERFEGLGVTVIRDWAVFTSPREVVAGGNTIRARRFVIASGSTPLVPPIPGLDRVPFLTSDSLFDLRERPEHLLVLGGGPIGIEMAQGFRRLGAAVTLIDARALLPREDPEAVDVVRRRLATEGVELSEGSAAVRVRGAPGRIVVEVADGRTFEGSHILVALGRQARTEGLGLEAAGVATDGSAVVTDWKLRTSNRRILAIGDASGRGGHTHLAGHHAGIVIRQALFGLPARMRVDALPRVVYADPELAQVGLTEDEARLRHGGRLDVFRADFARNDRARAEAETDGFLKLMVVGGRTVGATIVGQGAGEMAAFWSLAIGQRLPLGAVAGTVFPYPTRSEVSKHAAGAYFSSRLFGNAWVARAVRAVQRLLP